ncbi:MAG: glycosyltransferase [Acidobacteria bacterium]|nr:glycosyltransferase [Acidobacteriota bacterium]
MSRSYRVVVAAPQVPFLRGGAELHAELTVTALRKAGHEVDLVTLPYTWTGEVDSMNQALAWRLANFEEAAPGAVDLVIATKYPSYLARHPNKIAWVFHQQREVYDLHPTGFGNFGLADDQIALREALVELDMEALLECRALFTNSGNTARRMEQYCGIPATPLYAPPPLHDQLRSGPHGDYLFFVGRLDPIKRLDMTIEALAATSSAVTLKIAGRGPAADALKELAERLGVSDRVEFLGFVSDEDVLELMAGCLGMVLTPHDEDYGFTTLEAFFAGKPVVTTTDAGGVLEWVEDEVTGFVVAPDPAALAGRIDDLFNDRAGCERMGLAGRERVCDRVSWDKALAALTATLD